MVQGLPQASPPGEGPSFPSKVDRWLAVVLALGPIVGVGGGVLAVVEGRQPLWVAVAPLVLFAAIYGLAVFPIRYTLGDEALIIRFGVFRSRVPYAKIRQVVPTGNPISSPALSLDRLHVDAGHALGPNISPADRAGFLAALAARCPHLRHDAAGERLLPRDGV